MVVWVVNNILIWTWQIFSHLVNIFLGMYSDNETVDVASSDETEDSDNDKEDNINDVNNDKNQQQQPTSSRPSEVKSPSLSDILSMGHNNLDFLSEIYNTAFSKVPKVR